MEILSEYKIYVKINDKMSSLPSAVNVSVTYICKYMYYILKFIGKLIPG